MFTLIDCSELSIIEIAGKLQEGYSVMRSPHVGNLYPANLAVGYAGIPLVLFDRVFGRKDLLYHPNQIIKGGRSEKICSDLILMARAHVDHDSKLAPERAQRGARVATAHLQAVRDALKASRTWVKLWTPYLDSEKEFVLAILERVSQKHPEIWYRRMDENGLIVEKLQHGQSPHGGWQAIKGSIFGLTHPTSGWLVTNAVNIFLNACIEAKKTQQTVVYHLGGVDMAGYIRGMIPQISSFLEAAADVAGAPKTIAYHFGTITAMRYVGPVSEKDAIGVLFQTARDAVSFDADVRDTLSKSLPSQERHRLVGTYSEKRKSFHTKVKEAAHQARSVLYDVRVPTFFSQYDALDSLFVHEEALHTPLGELQSMWNYIQRHTRAR